ncbi:MAG: hypothetical protein JWN70_5132 [Planctomycetaceae bacterium]|nr:hypothetical protein [Planctomycetaceae bacterium]
MLSNASLATIQDALLIAQIGLILIFVGWLFQERLSMSWGLMRVTQ